MLFIMLLPLGSNSKYVDEYNDCEKCNHGIYDHRDDIRLDDLTLSTRRTNGSTSSNDVVDAGDVTDSTADDLKSYDSNGRKAELSCSVELEVCEEDVRYCVGA